MASELEVELRVQAGRRANHEIALELRVPAGVSALCGPSGIGKTTVLNAIAGLFRPDMAEIRLAERTLFSSRSGVDLPPERRRVGFVFQSLALFPHLSAIDNVAYGLPKTTTDRRREAQRWLERTQVPHLAQRKPNTFSGGEAQRVALARALASSPQLLLLDEPFTALEEDLRVRLGGEVVQIVSELGIPCLLVTHDRAEAGRLAQRIFELRAGGR
ncbi:MAG: ATP-binding cassette domain-containing protein [Myxococcales bacterium]